MIDINDMSFTRKYYDDETDTWVYYGEDWCQEDPDGLFLPDEEFYKRDE